MTTPHLPSSLDDMMRFIDSYTLLSKMHLTEEVSEALARITRPPKYEKPEESIEDAPNKAIGEGITAQNMRYLTGILRPFGRTVAQALVDMRTHVDDCGKCANTYEQAVKRGAQVSRRNAILERGHTDTPSIPPRTYFEQKEDILHILYRDLPSRT